MKRLIPFILALLLLTVQSSFAQTNYTKDYHPRINEAELAIIDADYQKALKIYTTVISEIQPAFAKDYSNLIFCAIKQKKYPLVYRYCDSLIAKGVSKYFFERHEGFLELSNTKTWKEYLENYDTKRVKLFKDENRKIRELLVKLSDDDQFLRKKDPQYSKFRDTIDKIDEKNMATIMMIWEKYGYPGEMLVGLDDPKNFRSPVHIVLHHHAQTTLKNGKHNIIPDLRKAVEAGQITPYEAGLYIDLVNDNNYLLCSGPVSQLRYGDMTSPYLIPPYSGDKLNYLNERRAEFGICSLDDFRKKAAFAIHNKRSKEFLFNHYEFFAVIDMPTKQHYDRFVSTWTKVE